MTNDEQKQLQDHVDSIARDIEQGTWEGFEPTEDSPEPSAIDYLSDALDIEYIVNIKGEYRGARVLVAFGGPNIYIDTQRNRVEGYWWNNKAVSYYSTDGFGLDDTLEELWNYR